MVHQFCFSMFSTLPFAIGTVQDAGEYYPFTSDGRTKLHYHKPTTMPFVIDFE